MKGVNITIGADTKQFEKDIKKVDGRIRGTNNIVDSLNKSLELDFDDSRFSEAMKQAQKVIKLTEEKAQALKEELKFLEDAGQVDSAAYQKFQSQLIRTEADAVKLKNKLEEIKNLKIDQLSQQFKNVGDGISKAGNALKPLSIAATGLLASFVAIGKSSISTASQIMDFSEQVNISAESLQKWQYVAMQSGLENADLQNAFIKTQSALSDLATGAGGKGAEALSMLNLSTEQAAKGMEANLDIILERLNAIEDPILKAAMANDIFGDRLGAKLIPLLSKGGEGLATLYAEFEVLGYMTNEQAQSLSDFDDVLNQIRLSLSNVKNQMGAALLPIMQMFASFMQEKIVPAIQNVSEWFTNLSESQQKFLFGALGVVAGLAPGLLVIGKLASGIGGLISSTGGLTKVLSLLSAHPIIGVIGAVAALLGIMYAKNETFRESINNLVATIGTALMPVFDVLGSILSSLMQVLGPIIDLIAVTLSPIIDYLAFSISLLGEQLKIALIPLQFLAKIFEVIIAFISPLIEGITTIASAFQNLFGGVLDKILGKVRGVTDSIMKFFEDSINWIIDKVNWLIDKINKVTGVVGVSINKIDRIDLSDKKEQKSTSSNTISPEKAITPEQVITNTSQNYSYPQSITNNDYSQKEIKIEVIVQNYAEEVDVDKMVDDINLKLAEQF